MGKKSIFDVMLWLNYQQTAQVCQSQTGLCVCVCAGCYTAQCRWCSRWPYWEIWRSWQVGSASPSFISSVVSLETSPLPCSCPTELRWVLHMNTCMHGLTHKQMKWTHIDSKKKTASTYLGGLAHIIFRRINTSAEGVEVSFHLAVSE